MALDADVEYCEAGSQYQGKTHYALFLHEVLPSVVSVLFPKKDKMVYRRCYEGLQLSGNSPIQKYQF